MKTKLEAVLAFLLAVAVGIILVLISSKQAHAATYPAPNVPVVASQNTASTNLPTTYTTGAQFHTGLVGKSNICVINGASTAIAGALGSTATNCASAADSIIIPASGSACFERVSINSKVCFRSLGSAISSGTIYSIVW